MKTRTSNRQNPSKTCEVSLNARLSKPYAKTESPYSVHEKSSLDVIPKQLSILACG